MCGKWLKLQVDEMLYLPTKIMAYKSYRKFGFPKTLPMNYAFGITQRCNLRCKTCSIWKLYEKKPKLNKTELTTKEFEKVFASIGKNAILVTLTGGEPFLREDLVEICESIQKNCSPMLVNIVTNGTIKTVTKYTEEILKIGMNLKITFSLDGTRALHNEIRGVDGAYEKLVDNYTEVKKMKKKYENLTIGVNTTVSSFNVQSFEEIYDLVKKKFQPNTFTIEIAENRPGFFNFGEKKIRPSNEYCISTINHLIERVERDYSKSDISRIVSSSRVEFYNLILETLKEKKQLINCYAGFNSCYIDPYGKVLPCCSLDDSKSLGNLRKVEYDFKKLWFSKKADKVREFIKTNNCYCMSVCSAYTNMLCSISSVFRILMRLTKQ